MIDLSSESFDPKVYFKFDDIQTYVEVFTQSSTPENLGNNIEVYNQQIKQLESLFQFFTNLVQEMEVPKSYFNSAPSIYISNKIIYSCYYLFKRKIKLFRFKEYLYSETISIIASIISLMKKNKEEKSEIMYCQIDELELFLNDKIKNNCYIVRSQDRIERLTSFIHPNDNAEIPVFQLKVALKESLKNLNEICGYSSYGSFDDFLYYYIILSNPKKIRKNCFPYLNESEKNFELFEEDQEDDENNMDKLIDELIKISIQNLKKTHFISFITHNQNISFKIIDEKMFGLLNIQKPEEQIILKTSLIRIIFDRMYQYQEFSDLLNSKLDEEMSIVFQSNCKKMCSKTPQEMQVSPDLLNDDLMNKSFKFIIENDDFYLKKAIEYLSYLPFFTNPIDILAHVFFVLKQCESFLIYQKNNINDEDIHEFIISFDDIFPLFCSVISYCCPSNCIGIRHFLEIIQGFVLNSQLNYANSIFLSAIKYIVTEL